MTVDGFMDRIGVSARMILVPDRVEVAMNDEVNFSELIRQVRGGDEEAAAELVRQYEPEIRREVRMRLRLRDPRLRRVFDSMDIVQSVLQSFFLRAANGQYDLDLPNQLRGLLVAMAQNKLAEQVRRQKRARRDFRRTDNSPLDVASGVEPGDSPSEEVVLKDLLVAFRTRLGEDERRLADLRTEGLTWEAVAAAMGGTPEARRKQLNRAVDRVALDLGLITPNPDP